MYKHGRILGLNFPNRQQFPGQTWIYIKRKVFAVKSVRNRKGYGAECFIILHSGARNVLIECASLIWSRNPISFNEALVYYGQTSWGNSLRHIIWVCHLLGLALHYWVLKWCSFEGMVLGRLHPCCLPHLRLFQSFGDLRYRKVYGELCMVLPIFAHIQFLQSSLLKIILSMLFGLPLLKGK